MSSLNYLIDRSLRRMRNALTALWAMEGLLAVVCIFAQLYAPGPALISLATIGVILGLLLPWMTYAYRKDMAQRRAEKQAEELESGKVSEAVVEPPTAWQRFTGWVRDMRWRYSVMPSLRLRLSKPGRWWFRLFRRECGASVTVYFKDAIYTFTCNYHRFHSGPCTDAVPAWKVIIPHKPGQARWDEAKRRRFESVYFRTRVIEHGRIKDGDMFLAPSPPPTDEYKGHRINVYNQNNLRNVFCYYVDGGGPADPNGWGDSDFTSGELARAAARASIDRKLETRRSLSDGLS
jgi:hypothetical protein